MSSLVKEYEMYTPNQDLYHKQLKPLQHEVVNMEFLAKDIGYNRINHIAASMQRLTYGQMVTLATEIWQSAIGGEIDGSNLAATIHAWATRETKE